MNVLIIDLDFDALDFALRCKEYGHQVKWYVYMPRPCRVGQGMGIEIVHEWRKYMDWAKDGLIWLTVNSKLMADMDKYRERGYNVFGPSEASAALEIERAKGMKLFQSAGIDIAPYQEFESLEAAYKFARKSDRAWVFKYLGDVADKSSTYVSSDPADLCSWLTLQMNADKDGGKCILQEKIDLLCEIAISGIHGPEGFLEDKWVINFEHKKLMPGDNGPQTGEMGTVQQFVKDDMMAGELLLPLDTALRALGHCGFIDVNAGLDKAGKLWPFEFTARVGWPQMYLYLADFYGDPVKWMRDLLHGKDTLRVSYDATIGVVCGLLPRFPYYGTISPAMVEGYTISGIDESNENDVHPIDVMRGRGMIMRDNKVVSDQIWQTAGQYVLVATARGKTVTKARDKVYKIVDQIQFPNKTFRNDIGDKVIELLPQVHSFGYATEIVA